MLEAGDPSADWLASRHDHESVGERGAAEELAAGDRVEVDPFKEWICEQLQVDPSIQSLRLREMATELGYAGGKSIFDDYVPGRPSFGFSAAQ